MMFKSGTAKTHIDYFLLMPTDSALCKACKVILRKSLMILHKLLVMDVEISKRGKEIVLAT